MSVVLVVEDDADLLRILDESLTLEGWDVLMATSPESALRAASSRKVDVVLADILEAEGVELQRTFRSDARLRSVPFVFMTGSLTQARALRGTPVLIKPFDLNEVTSMLNRCTL